MVAASSFGFVLIQLDVSIVNVALPRIAADLHASLSVLQWVVDAYTVAFAVLLLSFGFLGDRLGAKRTYLGGMALFAAASLGCGMATGPIPLVLSRALQGVGASAMLPASLSLLNHAFAHAPAERARAVGWWTAAGAISIASGPVVGGLLLDVTGWRGIFLVNPPLCLLGAALVARVPDGSSRRNGRGVDLPGQILVILALAGLITAVIELRPLGIGHPVVLAALAMALLAGPAFVAVEARSSDPMLPLRFFRNPTFSSAVAYGTIANLTYYGIVFVLSLYLQWVKRYSPVQAGLAFLPLTATFFLSNILSGWVVSRAGSRWPMVVGAVIDASGFALLATLGAESPYLAMLPAFALLPIGMGLGVPAMTTAVLASVDTGSSGVASGVLNSARQAGGAIGVALFGAMAGDHAHHVVTGLHFSALTSVLLLLGAAGLAFVGVRALAAPVAPSRLGETTD